MGCGFNYTSRDEFFKVDSKLSIFDFLRQTEVTCYLPMGSNNQVWTPTVKKRFFVLPLLWELSLQASCFFSLRIFTESSLLRVVYKIVDFRISGILKKVCIREN